MRNVNISGPDIARIALQRENRAVTDRPLQLSRLHDDRMIGQLVPARAVGREVLAQQGVDLLDRR